MKLTTLAGFGLIVAACAHDERPVAPSSAAVDQSTSVPSNNPDFTPPENKVGQLDDAESNRPAASGDTTAPRSADGTASGSPSAAAPAVVPPESTRPAPKADNTAVNSRDRDGAALTPMDQGGSETDRKITQQIRQAVMKDGSLSFSAKNVKIITVNGKVTLRGAVKNVGERNSIDAAARNVAGVGQVDNALEVAN